MTATVEIYDGETGWPLAEALDRECYPPEVMETIVWRDVAWARADKRFFVRLDGEPVCHVGLYLREARDGEANVLIGGIGGVMTLPRARRLGFAGRALKAATEEMKGEACDFGLLFCEPQNVAFYQGRGWTLFPGDVVCEQPTGRIKFDIMHTMAFPVAEAPKGRVIDLCGLPW